MLFSIITPCFNSEKTIKRTLESVLNQTCKDYEYIIVDGGSKDGTLDIIRSYEDKFEGRLKIISEPDKGIYDAMNKGINVSQGQLVGIVNSDDFYENDALENIAHHQIPDNPYQIIYGMMRIINMEGEELSIVFYHHRNMDAQIINHPTCFISRKLYEDFGMYDLKFKSASDYDFMLKMVRTKKVCFIPVYKIISNFTKGGMSGTYTGIQEDNDVRFKYHLVSSKKHALTKAKNALKHSLGV